MASQSTKSRRVPRKLLRVVALSAGASLAACGSDDLVFPGSYVTDASADDASVGDAGTTVHDASPDVIIGTNVNDAGADVVDGSTIRDAAVDGDGGTDA